MDLQRIQHALARDNDLLWLLLYRQRAYKRRNFLGRLPLGELAETLLARPHRGVYYLEKELPSTWVEYEDSPIDWLRGEVALEGLMDSDAVDIGVINEPDDLITEQL